MANVLDMLGRAALRIGGMSPQKIRQQTRANKPSKPMPKPRGSKPAPTRPKPPAPGSTRPVGQTSLFNAKGQPRDFRNPNVSANRPPTIDRAVQGPRSALRSGPVRPPAPGQRNLFGNNPSARPGGNFRAPSVPRAGEGIRRFSQDAMNWVAQNSRNARVARATQGRGIRDLSNNKKIGLELLGIPTGVASAVGRLAFSNFGLEGENPDTKARLLGYKNAAHQRQMIAQQKAKEERANQSGPVGPQQTPEMVARYRQERDARHAALRADLNAQPPAPRSPAASAPVHASPSALGSAYAPQAGAATRPNTPVSAARVAAPPQPMSPQYGGNDEPGRLGQSENGYAGRISQPSPVGPVADGGVYDHMVQATRPQQPASRPDANGIDMERRRAFLDADNSLDGMQAVRDLLKRRKLTISVSD